MPTDAFARAVKDWPEVLACHALAGDMDYLLRVQVEDLDHVSRFVMDSLLKHPGVLDVKSSFVLDEVKGNHGAALVPPRRVVRKMRVPPRMNRPPAGRTADVEVAFRK